uniref:Uncharacterized protein n=1 Tax=Ditylenchus dipsaci TaxID=166011 RepID=A0A915DEF8_9BILA
MQSLAIEDCQLSSMPLDLLQAARHIKLITLTNNKIKLIEKRDLEMASQTLHYLDLSGNLISDAEIGSFSQLKQLKFLYLGEHNYANQQIKHEISLLPSLQVLDLTRMDGIGGSNDSSSLRWFNNSSLEKLKLTGCSLRVLNLTTFQNLKHLTENRVQYPKRSEAVRFVHNNISLIEEGSFQTLKRSIESLSLHNNKLKSIDLNNPWTCDLRLYKVISWINQRYKWAASHSAKFTLLNPTSTVCHRPYSKQGTSVFELDEEDFEYQPDTDTTTKISVTSTLESEIEENSTLDWKQQTIIVGGQEDIFANTSLAEDADAGKPTYDINSVKYGQRYSPNKSSNTWVSGVIVILLVIVTAISVICVAKQKVRL